jgi:hypothetical protein
MTDTALATREEEERTPAVITTPKEYVSSLRKWHQHQYHVLSPAMTFSGLPPQYGMVAAMVQIDPDPEAGEVYRDPLYCKDGEVAITKMGLSKIAQAAGMTITTDRTDPRTIANYWEVRATARYTGLDGTQQSFDATVEYDLRDGSPRVQKMRDAAKRNNRSAEAQIVGARQHGLRGAESRAINAAFRQFGIKQKYTKEELAKPFVALRVSFQPDMSDPDIKRMATERGMQGTAALYPGQRAQLLPAEPLDVIGDVDGAGMSRAPKSVGSGTGLPVEPTKEAAPAYPEGFGLIKSLTPKTLKRKSDGQEFVKWTVVDHAGVEHVTIRGKFGVALQKHFDEKTPVEIVSDENDRGELEVVEITPWTGESNGALPGMEKL